MITLVPQVSQTVQWYFVCIDVAAAATAKENKTI